MVSNADSIYYPKGPLSGAISDTNGFQLSFLKTEPEAKVYVLMHDSRAQSWETGVRAKESKAGKQGELTTGAFPS